MTSGGLAAVSSSAFAALYSAFGKYDVVHIHAEGPAFFAWLPKMFGKRVVVTVHRYMDKSKVQFDFLCNKKKTGAYDDEIKSMGGRIYHTPGLNPAKYPVYLKYMRELFQEHPEYKIVEAHNGALGVYALHAAKVSKIPVRMTVWQLVEQLIWIIEVYITILKTAVLWQIVRQLWK